MSSTTAQRRLDALSKTIVPDSTSTPGEAQTPPFPFPVPNSTVPFWRIELHPLDSHRSTPVLPQSCDIAVIGAGYTGAAMVHHLLEGKEEKDSGKGIVILEAREACSGATGRNGGHLKPDVYFNVPKYKKMYGPSMATKIAAFESSQVYAVKSLVETEKIDCDFTLTRAVDTCLDQEHADKSRIAFEELLESGEPSTRDVQMKVGKEAEALSGVKGAKVAFSFTAAHIWPYKMVMHLLQRAVDRGVNLQTKTPILSVSDEPSKEGYYNITTPRGSLLAKKIVFATNGYTASVLSSYYQKIVPVRGICTRIKCPDGTTPPYLPNSTSVRYGPGFYDYQIPRLDGSIIVGGARHTFLHDLKQWYNVTDDSTLIEPAVSHFKEGLMQKTYKGWEKSGAELDRIWTGVMGYTSDLMPHIGAVPGKTNQYICAGFNGHGMPLILLATKGVAKMIQEGCEFEETGIPGALKTTEERLRSKENAILESKPQ
ncbi:DAO-domain-containing protein [Acephala macrosclerotiorum]|nr:DAO-domain-containing protein [Acephala macrosclerotiorum]